MLRKTLALILSTLPLCSMLAGGYDDVTSFQPPPLIKFHPVVRAYYSYLTIQTFLIGADGNNVARLPSPYNGLGFSGGFKYGEYFGLDLGYEYYFTLDRVTGVNGNLVSVNMRPQVWYSDVVGYLPILNVPGLDIQGTAGAVANDFSFFTNNQTTGASSYTNSVNINLRIGLGLRYVFYDHWAVNMLYHYVPNHIRDRSGDGWKSYWTADVGLIYQI